MVDNIYEQVVFILYKLCMYCCYVFVWNHENKRTCLVNSKKNKKWVRYQERLSSSSNMVEHAVGKALISFIYKQRNQSAKKIKNTFKLKKK